MDIPTMVKHLPVCVNSLPFQKRKKIKVNSLDCHYCINLPGPSFMYESNLSIATLLL